MVHIGGGAGFFREGRASASRNAGGRGVPSREGNGMCCVLAGGEKGALRALGTAGESRNTVSDGVRGIPVLATRGEKKKKKGHLLRRQMERSWPSRGGNSLTS